MPTTALTPDQIAALRALLAEVDSESAQDQGGGQLSENGIADESGDASTLSKGKPMRRIHGPYQERKGWRVKVVDLLTVAGKSTNTMFPTEIEARSAINRLRRKAEREIGISIDGALMTYEKHLTEKGEQAPLDLQHAGAASVALQGPDPLRRGTYLRRRGQDWQRVRLATDPHGEAAGRRYPD